ncbi:MAG: hypothetical protein SOT34_00415 [Candidatus Borkfalkiaceae bacterium]|nr:hypothetical protein [Christensenellaceae bacterium]
MSENYKEGNQTEYNKKTVYVSSGLKKNRKKKRLAGRGRNFAETGAVEEERILAEAAEESEEVAEVVEETAPVEEAVPAEAEEETAVVNEDEREEAAAEEETEEIAEVVEETAPIGEEEVPLEMSEEEEETVLAEEGSLDGTPEEIEETVGETEEEVAAAESGAACEQDEEEEDSAEEAEPEEDEEAEDGFEEEETEEPDSEEDEEVEEPEVEDAEEEAEEPASEEGEKAVARKEEFKLTAPADQEKILEGICAKRARKLIYRPNEILFERTAKVLGTDKNNEEGIRIKNILDAEIKQGVKLGYLDKFDGLKTSEIKEEYENDVVYEYADQEFKKTGLLLDGDTVKVYVYDWDLKSLHHVGCIDEESAALVRPYLEEKEKYSFDVDGIIVGGKYKKVVKDPETGKITIEKGNDGNLGLEADITVIKRKD